MFEKLACNIIEYHAFSLFDLRFPLVSCKDSANCCRSSSLSTRDGDEMSKCRSKPTGLRQRGSSHTYVAMDYSLSWSCVERTFVQSRRAVDYNAASSPLLSLCRHVAGLSGPTRLPSSLSHWSQSQTETRLISCCR